MLHKLNLTLISFPKLDCISLKKQDTLYNSGDNRNIFLASKFLGLILLTDGLGIQLCSQCTHTGTWQLVPDQLTE